MRARWLIIVIVTWLAPCAQAAPEDCATALATRIVDDPEGDRLEPPSLRVGPIRVLTRGAADRAELSLRVAAHAERVKDKLGWEEYVRLARCNYAFRRGQIDSPSECYRESPESQRSIRQLREDLVLLADVNGRVESDAYPEIYIVRYQAVSMTRSAPVQGEAICVKAGSTYRTVTLAPPR